MLQFAHSLCFLCWLFWLNSLKVSSLPDLEETFSVCGESEILFSVYRFLLPFLVIRPDVSARELVKPELTCIPALELRAVWLWCPDVLSFRNRMLSGGVSPAFSGVPGDVLGYS